MKPTQLVIGALAFAACTGEQRVEVGRAGAMAVSDAVVLVTAAPDIASLYFTLENHGAETDTLRGLSASMGTATLHNVVTEGGLTRMEPVGLLTIPPDGTIELRPGSYHVMLSRIAEPAIPGDSIDVRLTFAVNGQVGFFAPVLSFADGMERFER
jgi:copper(I)-binding protein